MAVSAVMGGLLFTNLSALTAAASYGTPKSNSTSQTSTVKAGEGNVASTSLKLAPAGAAEPDIEVPQPDKLDLWLEELAWKESNHQEKIKVLDWNGRYSYGCLQFQMGTFKAYMTQYGIVPATTPQVTWDAMIYDCKVQKSLAKLMIQDNYLNWKHWSYTVRNKMSGLPPIETAPTVAVVVAQ